MQDLFFVFEFIDTMQKAKILNQNTQHASLFIVPNSTSFSW